MTAASAMASAMAFGRRQATREQFWSLTVLVLLGLGLLASRGMGLNPEAVALPEGG